MTIFIELILIILLLCSSGFFSASETALVSLSPQKAKRLALRNPGVAQALLGWLKKPHELLIVILVGNTLTMVIFAALITTMAVRTFSNFPPLTIEILSWFLQTVCLVILAEMAPKFFARVHPEKTSIFVLPWLSRFRTILRPLLILFSNLMNFRSPPSKATTSGNVLTFSMEELKALLDEHEEGESGPPSESLNMMQSVLEIYDRRAESIMTPLKKVDYVEIDSLNKKIPDTELLLDLIVEMGRTRTPVKSKGKIIGFIHSDDLLPLVLHGELKDLTKTIRKAMDVPTDRRVSDLLQDLKISGIHTGFVRNKRNEIVGLVTLEDVLEEITGEILDEFDVARTRGVKPQ